MPRLGAWLLAGLSIASSAVLAQSESAAVTIEASHGGAGTDLTNTTIVVPLNSTYVNTALDTVSYLFLTGATGVPLESITCTPYRYANATGSAGLPFTAAKPSLLSTNTVQVGSLVCVSSAMGGGSGAGTTSSSSMSTSSPSTSTTSASTSTSRAAYTNATTKSSSTASPSTLTVRGSTIVPATASAPTAAPTSTFVTTVTASSGLSGGPVTSTITSVVPAGTPAAASSAGNQVSASASATTSVSPNLQSGAAAELMPMTEGAWFGLAIAALGLAMLV